LTVSSLSARSARSGRLEPDCGLQHRSGRATFAEALARKRMRVAFPNEFNTGLKKFKDRIKRAEEKATAEGRLITALEKIRVQATPHWDAARAA